MRTRVVPAGEPPARLGGSAVDDELLEERFRIRRLAPVNFGAFAASTAWTSLPYPCRVSESR